MNPLPLKLKPLAEPGRQPVSWFLAGDDSRAWIEEICRWQIPQKGLRLFVVPRSQSDRKPAGVLVVLAAGSMPKTTPRGLAFGVLAGKLYLPVDAELSPPVEAAELQLLHDVQIFHPAFGLSGFAESEGLRLCDLLRQSPSRVEDWNFAQPGMVLNQHLRSVQLIAPPPEEMFGDASQEIGSEPPTNLPPFPDEPSDSKADKLGRGTKKFFNKVLLSALNKLPRTATHRTWINDLQEWAAKNLWTADQNLDKSRNKELHRLLHQLDENPEQGLRHAIPLNSPLHRGIAPPSNRLGARDTNFNVNRLSGGTPGDLWNIPSHLEQQLRTKYRELANREMQLGRHRRAAYIFAELLGDLESAASALKQGRHFTEAAILYKDHLRRPREAASCLVEGGQFMEAIAIYEQEGCYMEIGNLHAQLGQKDEAIAAYRRQAEKFLEANDFISAAKLTETELESPREALGILTLGLQHQPQTLQCLEASFDLMGRMGWHQEALELVSSYNKSTDKNSISPVARLLGRQSHTYPDHMVRHAAADMVKILASRRLQVAAPSEAVLLTDALVKLAPEDRLLARDAVRFMAKRNEDFRLKTRSQPVKPAGIPVLVRTFDLGKDFTLQTVKSCGSCFFALGYSNNSCRLIRGNWEGLLQQVAWPNVDLPPKVFADFLYLEVDETSYPPAMAVVAPSPAMQELSRFPETPLPAEDQFAGVVPAGTPDWLSTDFVALCWRGNLAWLLRQSAQGIILECRHRDGRMIMNTELEGIHPELGDSIRHVSLLVQREMVWIALNRKLFLHRPGKALREWEAETDILSLQSSAPHLPLCALSRLHRGVALHWFHSLDDTVNNICAELESPLACFTGNGTLVLLSRHEGRICEVSRDAQAESPFNWPGQMPIALVRAQNSDEFAIFTGTGKVQVFRIQRPGGR